MTTIHYWCPVRRVYVSVTLPIEVAYRLMGAV